MWVDDLNVITKVLIVAAVLFILFVPPGTRDQIWGCVKTCKDNVDPKLFDMAANAGATPGAAVPAPPGGG
jgi:hypothetical protein